MTRRDERLARGVDEVLMLLRHETERLRLVRQDREQRFSRVKRLRASADAKPKRTRKDKK